MDLVIRCQSLPMPGETIMAESSMEVCGGKGANQAVAAARAGGQVTMIGRVGDDAFGGRLISNLEQAGVDTRLVERTRDCASGLAIVAVERSSQNSIMVVAGANGRVCPDDVEAARGVIEASDILLLQLEVPTDAVIGAIEIARKAGVRIVLDPAPSLNSWPPDLLDVDLLCPNRSEAARMLGVPDESIETREDAEITNERHERDEGRRRRKETCLHCPRRFETARSRNQHIDATHYNDEIEGISER